MTATRTIKRPAKPRPARITSVYDTWTEAQFQETVIGMARALGWRVYHTHDSRRSDPGYPDLTMVRGRVLRIWELKSETGTLRRNQADWIVDLQTAGVEALVLRPSDMPRIKAMLS